jgi:DNA-binding transcriptional LysR family regulator
MIESSHLISLYYVAEFLSFTKAAAYLKCSKSHISKQIAYLERQVGSALFNRNARMLNLTPSGEALFQHARQLVQEIHEVENTIHTLQQKAEGKLRITTPQGYADYILTPHLHRFLEQYPKIMLEMKHTSEYVDLLKEKIDVAIRITHEPPLDKVAKHLGVDRSILCASKSYLEQHGVPKTPQQLHHHWGLAYSSSSHEKPWAFIVKNETVNISIKTKIASNSFKLILKSALDGLGIAKLPQFIVQEHINNGSLFPVLSDFYTPDVPIYAIFNQSRIIPPKTHAFIQFLLDLHQNPIHHLAQ